MAGDDDAVALLLQDGDGVGADEAAGGVLHGVEQIRTMLERLVNQVGNNLGVGVQGELIAAGLEFGFELGVVFDNAVVHDSEAAADVRVGVALGGHAVGRPAGVGNAEVGAVALGLGGEFGDTADGAQAGQALLAADGQAGGVVAAILKLVEPLDEDRDDVAMGHRRDDSTHGQG